MSLRMQFVERVKKGEKVAPLCREFGISRTTAHKWVKRFESEGYEGLEDKSRRPKSTPFAMAEDIVLAVLELRERHSRWGSRTIALALGRKLGEAAPSERTVARILRRAGKVRERRERRPLNLVDRAPHVEATRPNEVWTIDFKGWWRARNGEKCQPLTVRDAFSRCVLAVVLCPAQASAVRAVMERLFRRHGVPKAIQCDNGEPFISVTSRGGLSVLSAWWVSLGIQLVRSRVGCPQDNGAHERMHADIAAELQSHPAASRVDQQRALDRWRQEFNHVRPHHALGGKTPAEVYKPVERQRMVVQAYRYPPHCRLHRVGRTGQVHFDSTTYFVSASLRGQTIGIEPVDALHVRLWFHHIDLGTMEIEPERTEDIVRRWSEARAGLASRTRSTLARKRRAVPTLPQVPPQVVGLPPGPPLTTRPGEVESASDPCHPT